MVVSCQAAAEQPCRAWVLVPGDDDAAWRIVLPVTGSPVAPHTEAREQDVPAGPRQVPVADAGPPRGVEWMLGAGYGSSIDLLQSKGGRRYVAGTVSWGRDLTRDAGPGRLRGRLMWAVEAMPVYAQHAPSSTAGVGLSPLVWRWRFTPARHAAVFAELAFGGLFTAEAVPEGTERLNFLTHGGLGVRWLRTGRWALVTAYRFQHVSNGNQLRSNPGVNAHVVWVGVGR